MDDKSGQHVQTPYGGEAQVLVMNFNPLDDKQKVSFFFLATEVTSQRAF